MPNEGIYYYVPVDGYITSRHLKSSLIWGQMKAGHLAVRSKILHFQSGGLLKFLPKKPQKVEFWEKSGGLLEFCIGGGLIKSGGLFAWIRYFLQNDFVR